MPPSCCTLTLERVTRFALILEGFSSPAHEPNFPTCIGLETQIEIGLWD